MAWWHDSWKYRRQLDSDLDGDTYQSGVHYLHFDLDLQNLASLGEVRSDYADVRVIYASGAEEYNIPYFIASGRSPTRIYFPAQNNIPQTVDIGGHGSGWLYHVYYGNVKTGDVSGVPQAYVNRNFPQAPYTPTTEPYQPGASYSGFVDKCLYRLNDDPSAGSSSGFLDTTGKTVGVAIFGGSPHPQSGVYKGKEGRLDVAAEFDRSNRGSIEVLDNYDGTTVASGDWSVDFWVHPYTTAGTQYWFAKKRNDNHSTNWPIYGRFNYNGTHNAYSVFAVQKRADAINASNQWTAGASAGIEANEWSHVRIYYRPKNNVSALACVFLYVNGVNRGLQSSCGYPPAEPYKTQMESGNCVIGGALAAFQYELDGRMEQFRYSTHPWFAELDYNQAQFQSRFAPPDWINNEYTVSLGDLEVNGPAASGIIGGVARGALGVIETSGQFGGFLFGRYQQTQDSIGGTLRSTAVLQQSGIVGGFLYSDATTHDPLEVGGFVYSRADDNIWYLGGFVNALPLVPQSGSVGGVVNSLAADSEDGVGGFTIGTWSVDGNSSTDGLARALVKGAGDETANQTFRSDAQFVIYAEDKSDFDAQLRIVSAEPTSFDSVLEILKVKRNPHVEIIDVQTVGDGPWVVTVTASGHAFDINNNAIASGIHRAHFVWTDGERTIYDNIQQSGYIFSSQHIYNESGLYKPIVVGYDKLHIRGSDQTELNFASGIEYPYITLSGAPRVGEVPPPLTVDFEHSVSGTLGSYTVWWDYANGITQFNNSPTTTTSYPMAGDYVPYITLRDERNVPVVDTLRVGFNR